MKLKKNVYFNREDYLKHVSTILLGRYALDGSTSVSFHEVAAYLNLTPDALRMKKKDSKTMKMLQDAGIKVKKIRGVNHFYLAAEEDNTMVI